MFTNQRPHPEWRALTAKTCGLAWGMMITFQQIEEGLGLRRSDDRFMANVQRWKKEMLREYQRPLVSVRGEGYRILPFDEIAPRAKHLVRLGARSMARGVSVAEHAPFEEMPDADRRAVIDFGVRAGMLVQMCREKLHELKLKAAASQEGSQTPRVLKGSK